MDTHLLQFFINHSETMQACYKCSLDVHMTLELQSDNCSELVFFLHFELYQAQIVIFQN